MRRIVFSVFIFCLFAGFVYAQDPVSGKITGKLVIKGGGPVADGMIYFFSAGKGPVPDYNKYWKIPDNVINTNDKGEFSIMLPEGKYYFGAIKRLSGKDVGPPAVGDYFHNGADEKGNLKELIVKKDKPLDIGILSAVPFPGVVIKDKLTAIEGKILFDDGKPVEGALVFAFISPEMKGRPAFVSGRTGKDGVYLLRVYEGGNYYLKVRDVYGGGALIAGEIIGVYGKNKNMADPVAIKTGEIIKGADITVNRFKGRGPQNE